MDTTTEPKRPVEDGHDVLITPTASARKELPPERYQITRGAVINQVTYHVACHNALLRAADAAKSNKSQLKLLGEAEDELGIAERTIEELEALSSDEDVDYVLGYLKRVHHWEPRDIRPKKIERTPRHVRAGHKLGTLPPVTAAPFVRLVKNPGHGLGKGATTYDAPMPPENKVATPILLVDKKNNFDITVKLAAEGDYFVGALDFHFGRADSKRGGHGRYTPIHRVNGEFKSEVHAITYFVEEAIEHLLALPKLYPAALPADLWENTLNFLIEKRAQGLRVLDLVVPKETATTAPGPGEPARYFHPDKNLPYIHTHKLEPWIWVGADGAHWLFHAPLAPGWTVKDNEHLGPLLVAPKDLPHEAYHAQKREPLALGKQPANGKVKMMVQRILDREALKREATNATNVASKAIGRKLKSKPTSDGCQHKWQFIYGPGVRTGEHEGSGYWCELCGIPREKEKPRRKKLNAHQAGDVLPDGTMVVDPTNAIPELHDQANPVPLKVEAVPPGKTIEELLPAAKPAPPVSASNLTELAKPFGADRRAREVVKKRFTSLYGKLSRMDAEERAAFLSYVNAHLQ